MKNNLRRWLTLQNLLIFLGALYIGFQIYELPAKVKNLQERLLAVEKDIVMFKTQQQLILNATYETRADVKQILKDVKL